jgi:cytochrome c oxidase cbb3-type subunit 1
LVIGTCIFALLLLSLWLFRLVKRLQSEEHANIQYGRQWLKGQVNSLDAEQINHLVSCNRAKRIHTKSKGAGIKAIAITVGLTFSILSAHAASEAGSNIVGSPGMLIMLGLIFIPLLASVLFIGVRISRLIKNLRYRRIKKEVAGLTVTLEKDSTFYTELIERKKALDFRLNDLELGGELKPVDDKGLVINPAEIDSPRFLASKRKAAKKHDIDPALIRLILWYLGTATFWLVAGTSIGEYLGIKFVSPDVDHVSWLSFGRLRPVHTNMVFWGWSSLAMIGLGYYVVTTVSNAIIFSIKLGYRGLILLNSAVIAGSLCLMAGINNGGGEYREYIWPVMGLFAAGVVITLYNYLKTIASRKTKEIYISNWYIIAALMFLTVIVIVGYVPWWQNGLGETIVQGYYMHQAVGMWFMLFNLGLIYYFLPQQLNTPIYSYSLGILAFWSQILFYTLIGTHHFIFSSIPWWLQTVAIVGSMGMLIPVFAGTTNFLMTMRGNYHKISRSYTLPFYLVGVIFYFTGSTQGTAEAFRETNLVWHFTDFTVAHSHLTMYGIIAFMLWASIYTLVPRLTGKEPKQSLVGAHFWMALIGMLFYTIPLMLGGTLKGIAWGQGKPFIDGVILMAPYWLWRAIGGSLMWASHLVFAWNLYAMTAIKTEADIKKEIFEQLEHSPVSAIAE